MKKLFIILIGIFYSLTILVAQEAPPQAFSFKALITKNGSAVVNKMVYLQISILQDNTNGPAVYVETFTPTTNEFGQVDLEIGRGTVVSGDFSAIEWSKDEYFLKIEYTLKTKDPYQTLSTTQLLSVPYSLYSGEAGNGFAKEYTPGEMRPVINLTNGHITLGGEPDWWSRLRVDGGFGITPGPENPWGALFAIDARSTEGGLQYNIASLSSESSEGAGKFQIADLDGITRFIMHNGHIGINNLNPDYSLDVAGDINFSGELYQNGSPLIEALKEIIYDELLEAGLNGIVKDIDGNVYKTIKIGSQIWMAENLSTTEYNDGSSIPLVTDDTEWRSLADPAYCWFMNDQATYGDTYGALYNWYVVDVESNGGKNVCPTGWHVPAEAEWTTLTTYLGGESVAGGKLKEAGTLHWRSPNDGATNEVCFTALPGGDRDDGGAYTGGNFYGSWWSTTEYSISWATCLYLVWGSSHANIGNYSKTFGKYIRCLKD